ncbi:hypothetical protein PSPO01_08894 [Paraphaeosphaeria sporulosa]
MAVTDAVLLHCLVSNLCISALLHTRLATAISIVVVLKCASDATRPETAPKSFSTDQFEDLGVQTGAASYRPS